MENEIQVLSRTQQIIVRRVPDLGPIGYRTVVKVVDAGPVGPPGVQGIPGVNGVHITVSTDPPPDPYMNQVWLDIS